MTFVKIVFQDPLLPVHLHPEYFYPLDLGHPIFQDPPLKKKPQPLQQTIEQQPHRAFDQTKSKQKQNQATSHSN